MFNRANQVQTVNVNEWVEKLLAANDDVRAVERIRRKLDEACADYIESRASDLEKRKSMYDFYFEGMPIQGDFEKWVMDLIDYRMPDDLVDKWHIVCAEYQRVKASESGQA